MKLKITLLAILSVLIYSCASKSSIPTEVAKKEEPKAVVFATVLNPELMEGKTLYENNCNKCHELYDTKAFSAEKWKPIVEDMRKKAKLSETDGMKIFNYVAMQ
ncbi:MAG TPA: cytochrome c [Flavobacterium sp.]|nr:cytochrome c [Flavobacterium sp.]HQW69414.1 cytochrome c [Flavobacterium sp.]